MGVYLYRLRCHIISSPACNFLVCMTPSHVWFTTIRVDASCASHIVLKIPLALQVHTRVLHCWIVLNQIAHEPHDTVPEGRHRDFIKRAVFACLPGDRIVYVPLVDAIRYVMLGLLPAPCLVALGQLDHSLST